VRTTGVITKPKEDKERLDKAPEVVEDKKELQEHSPRRINGVEIIDNSFAKNGTAAPLAEESADQLAQMPRWKREKLLRENRSKSTGESPPSGSGSNSPSLSTAGARKASLGSPAASSLLLSSSSSPTTAPAPESDPDFARLPRWKREKILRERRQSQDQQTPEATVRDDNDIQKSSLLSPSPGPVSSQPFQPDIVANGDTRVEESSIPLLDETKLPAAEPAHLAEPVIDLNEVDSSSASPLELNAAPEPVKRRRNRRPGSEDVEDTMAVSQVSRPARKSRIEDSLAEVGSKKHKISLIRNFLYTSLKYGNKKTCTIRWVEIKTVIKVLVRFCCIPVKSKKKCLTR
jgi:hypothetical protein